MFTLRPLLVLAACAVVGNFTLPIRGQDEDVSPSVVRVIVKQRSASPFRPWVPGPSVPNFGSGVVIEGGRILTNAHLAIDAVEVEIQPSQGGATFPARVVALAPDFDLAILEVRDESFAKDRPAVSFAEALPDVGQRVRMYGYPVGGHALRTTDGTVSRIEYSEYNFSSYGLRIEVEAAVSPGNSGGPAMAGDKLVGLVYGASIEGQNIGYLIPAAEIRTALDDLADGKYDGKLKLWCPAVPLENPALRAKLGLTADVTGVLCASDHPANADFPLKKGDIITRIGNYRIDNTGAVDVKEENVNLRAAFTYFVPSLAKESGDVYEVPLAVLREGREREVNVPVTRRHPWLFQPQKDDPLSYFVWGPLVFTPATEDIVNMLAASPYASSMLMFRASPLLTRRSDFTSFPGEQLVIVTAALPHRTMKGYDNPGGQVVQTINGTKIRNLRHLVETLRDAQGEFVEFEFADRFTQPLVFDRQEVSDAMEEILDENGIRRQSSDDLRAVWAGEKPKTSNE